MKITVYQKPTCSTCRQVYSALKEAGVDLEAVDYFITPLSETKIRELLRKMGISARGLLRAKADVYREMRLAEDRFTDDELIAMMAKHPELIQRPIVEAGDRAILARPAERLRDFLGGTP